MYEYDKSLILNSLKVEDKKFTVTKCKLTTSFLSRHNNFFPRFCQVKNTL